MFHANTTRKSGKSMRSAVTGALLAILVAASLVLGAPPARAATTFTVNNTEDGGDGACNPNAGCTLREAITLSNARFGADTIEFDIGGTGVRTITPASPLPTLTDAVTIDGYSQPGTRKNTRQVGTDAKLLVEVSRGNSGTNGLTIDADGVVVRGLVINRFPESQIEIRGGTGSKIEGNFIGTDHSGTLDLPGGDDGGVNVNAGVENVIGGSSLAARNLISGNDRAGIVLFGSPVDADKVKNNRIEGNLIGTKRDGTSPLGNLAGVAIVNSPGNTVGGAAPGAANTIAFNSGDGVNVDGDVSTGNRILGNSIFSNNGLGIDLEGGTETGSGVTANDPGDGDTGSNTLQNKPTITSASSSSRATSVRGSLDSTPGRAFTVQLYSNPAGGDEGKKFIGQREVTTGSDGLAAFAFKPARRVAPGQTITATATQAGNTSEFSAPRTVVAR